MRSRSAGTPTAAMERVDVAVVGAGQAGLATSHELTRAGVEHLVLERDRIGQAWRGRWDSFCLVTPNWTVGLPGWPPNDRQRSNHTMVWTGRDVLVWGGLASGTAEGHLADGAAFDPATDAWKPLPKPPILGRDRQVAVWTGQELLIWGGCCAATRPFADGAAFRPS